MARRDVFLLPLIAFITGLVSLGAIEFSARAFWTSQKVDTCRDERGAKPNCVTKVKTEESGWITYTYNDCGHRADHPCAKDDGSSRIAVIGTSVSSGQWVSFNETFSGRLERGLTDQCGRPVDVQDVVLAGHTGGEGGAGWSRIRSTASAALALKPDVLVAIVTPFDLSEYTPPKPAGDVRNGQGNPASPSFVSLVQRAKALVVDSRAMRAAQHFLYSNLPRYLPLYLQHGDEADFLRPPLSPAWEARLGLADRVLGAIADEAQAAHVPFLVAYVPSRAQAALVAIPQRGVDPFALPNTLSVIVRRHNAKFVDVTTLMGRRGEDSELYFPADSHPTGAGHQVIASAIRGALNDVPAFSTCSPPM